MIFSKMDAIRSLVGNDVSQPLGGDVIYNKGQTPPTEAEIDAEIKRLEDEWVSQEYARNRKSEYYALNQLELQFDDKEDGTTTWEDAIKAIKTKWPKDNSGPV